MLTMQIGIIPSQPTRLFTFLLNIQCPPLSLQEAFGLPLSTSINLIVSPTKKTFTRQLKACL